MMNRLICVTLGATATAFGVLLFQQCQFHQTLKKLSRHDAEIMNMIQDEMSNRIRSICVDRKT